MTAATGLRRAERAAVAALQAATLFANHPAGEVAAFLTTMAGHPREDTFCRPRHVLHPTTDHPTEDLRGPTHDVDGPRHQSPDRTRSTQ